MYLVYTNSVFGSQKTQSLSIWMKNQSTLYCGELDIYFENYWEHISILSDKIQGDFILHVAVHIVPTGSEGYTKTRKSLSVSHTLVMPDDDT
jgi:hypothetical protein